ncbi:MAG TPA: ATP-dependent DNA helicase RecG [Candidatus Hydrogenedentes bacterium]|nr:ATP-dependent DNA helicase RecG [Candidatus Hydrogenedentota bacterium]HRT20283.1 ATP-dependent DNA helicase RecG [Candidatus Hydrogenedentota bacterium]HRT65008.1 ATP-dependent DNA helicase RecG [Candidatus Hydrogenedentota bacterium]
MMTLDDPVESLSGIGPKTAALLGNLGVATLRDLLFYMPRDYQDRTRISRIADAREGETITIAAETVRARQVRLRGRLSMAVATLRDESGEMQATWFGRGFLAQTFKPGTHALFTGTVGQYKGPCLKNPDYELLSGDEEDRLNTGRIVPIYRLTEKVTQRMLRRWMALALDQLLDDLDETLPAESLETYRFPPIRAAMRAIHFPNTFDDVPAARERFAYEELLGIQLGVQRSRLAHRHEIKANIHVVNGPRLQALRAALPFALTTAQARAIADILGDMASPRPMTRLIQGDVGCGKTIVALHAVAAAADGGFQTAIMAPTEILAEQHYLTLRRALDPLGITVVQLTGSMCSPARIRKRIARGEAQVIVGTQALVQEKTVFQRLGLVIVDEQHRFGVCQRAALAAKGEYPDVLHTTATPIPRTLAMTVYGGMDITVIDELPPGRLPVKTRRIPSDKIPDLYAHVVEQARQGFQAYIICPLVDESEKRNLIAVKSHFEQLSRGPLSGVRTALLHGRLDAREKDDIMLRFKDGEIDVLFSTTVIEVGVDVPNATIMIIEDAGQFGVTQLHQLRGRVGRGAAQSYCFLLGTPKTDDGIRRLEILCATTNGFEIAEQDLLLRGPGEFQGVRQAGLSDLRVADLVRDTRLLDAAQRDAQRILARDPDLASSELRYLAAAARRFGHFVA